MKTVFCIVPQEMLQRTAIGDLEAAMRSTYRAELGARERLLFLWMGVPRGQSFVAGVENDAYVLNFEVRDGVDQDARERALFALNRVFCERAGIPLTKPMVSALDGSKATEFRRATQRRMSLTGRLPFGATALLYALRSKRRYGFLAIPVNA